jgi:oxaloacetate decarboxylase beta subunit
MIQDLFSFFSETGFGVVTWQMLVMWVVVGVLLFLAIAKGFEPLLLVPIAFGALLANLPTRGLLTLAEDARGDAHYAVINVESEIHHQEILDQGVVEQESRINRVEGGLFDFISQGIKLELFPPLIFLGVGALTDFGPLIANPRTLLLGGAAQFGVLFTFIGSILFGFSASQAASIGIIGGADGPTAIFLSNKLAPELLGAIAVAAYSYMALVPMIQPPIMRLLTTEKERKIRMKKLREVSKLEKMIFALLVTVVCILLVPDASPLIAMLMLGNFLRECGVTQRLLGAAQNEIINVVTIFLGTSVGLTMQGTQFLQSETIKIILLGVIAFSVSTAAGVLAAKLMNIFSRKNPINPLIGSAGVSAVPMAARVSQVEGQRSDPNNFLLMHAMGPNVAGVIGTAVIAGYFIATLAS